MRVSAAGRRFYRLVGFDPAEESDFVPQGHRLGYQPRRNASAEDLESIMKGISVYDTLEAARRQNELVFAPRKGGSRFRSIAVLDIPEDSAMVCDDSGDTEGHWDLYGWASGELFTCVTPPQPPL